MLKSILFVYVVLADSSNCDAYSDHGDSEGRLCLLQLRGQDGERQSHHHESGLGLAHGEFATKVKEKLHAHRESKAQEDAMGSCAGDSIPLTSVRLKPNATRSPVAYFVKMVTFAGTNFLLRCPLDRATETRTQREAAFQCLA